MISGHTSTSSEQVVKKILLLKFIGTNKNKKEEIEGLPGQMKKPKENNGKRYAKRWSFFCLLFLESGFLIVTYLKVANLARLGSSVYC